MLLQALYNHESIATNEYSFNMNKRESKYNFGIGLALILSLDFTIWIIFVVVFRDFEVNNSIDNVLINTIVFFGFWQYIYIIPLMFWQMVKQKMQLAYGMFIGSLPALLINIGFFVWIAILLKDGIGL